MRAARSFQNLCASSAADGPGTLIRPRERCQLLAKGGRHAQRGHRLRRDRAVDVDESADGKQAPGADAGEREDQQGRSYEDLVGETHDVFPS
jgi:hypothetical protein